MENDAIGDLWARKKIDNLVDDWHLGEKSAKQKIIDLSIKHNLMSKFTSFVAVEEKIVNPGGNSILADVHVDLPEGWNYDSVFGSQLVISLMLILYGRFETITFGFFILSNISVFKASKL